MSGFGRWWVRGGHQHHATTTGPSDESTAADRLSVGDLCAGSPGAPEVVAPDDGAGRPVEGGRHPDGMAVGDGSSLTLADGPGLWIALSRRARAPRGAPIVRRAVWATSIGVGLMVLLCGHVEVAFLVGWVGILSGWLIEMIAEYCRIHEGGPS